ncbi:3-oxoacyl-[acyl-carrier-protein] reductase [Culex quinquefasciatus]|uniref:(3R)-3-hydroxyacyl-CoA dehydrogenase n=2 Tax=Culex pipiens complex TaxID=518105 RepID=B0W411_CULQU|nr:estradiol 17-beta-dehydrogenase 8 [Culex quinquefasciatus]XP_039444668.1 estradiol 17-beta-dehydrogenase 8 [Culex pipiens pallens]EDS32604.1 3-oxoacyl-[acyl-carrier-protein] reductase [Culex quinquefasciatus]|eukprot:XP_001843445.1 3-oxoacyl-[acyl-carrier-protein] reductase [Culex quinquefasciatus]
MSGPLAGRLALVTGAGSGIGRITSQLLARDGAVVVAVDRNLQAVEETIKSLGGQNDNTALEMDVSSSASISQVLDATLAKYKNPPTIVVNSAGITRDNFLLKMPESDFDAVINVNLKGTWLMLQQFGKAMIDAKLTGSMVNVSSIVARSGNIGQSNYSPSKAGVEAMTKVVAREFGRYNIRVNAVVPGFIETPMTNDLPQKVKDMVVMQCALRRFGKPQEIAEVIAFLASDKSSYMNGTSVEVTGG